MPSMAAATVLKPDPLTLLSVEPLEEFTLFPKLPIEIRLKIFKLALPQGQNGKIVLCVSVHKQKSQIVFKIVTSLEHAHKMSHDVFDIGLSLTNFEARGVCKKAFPNGVPHVNRSSSISYNHGTTYIYIENLDTLLPKALNPSTPILTFSRRVLLRVILAHSLWPIYVEHLALPIQLILRPQDAIYMVVQFPQLQSFTWMLNKTLGGDAGELAYHQSLIQVTKKLIHIYGKEQVSEYEATAVLVMDLAGATVAEATPEEGSQSKATA